MAKFFGFGKGNAGGKSTTAGRVDEEKEPRAFIVSRKSQVLHRGRRDVDDQVEEILDGSTIAPTSVFSARGDEILQRLRERTS
jgi:hypothetical protein